MLAKAPEMRPSMAEVAARIDSVLATPVAPAATPKTTAAISGSHQGRLGTRIAIRRGMALLLLAVLVLVGLLEVISYWLPLSPPAGMVRIKAGRFTMGSQPQQIDAALAMARRTDCSGCTRELFEHPEIAHHQRLAGLIDRNVIRRDHRAGVGNLEARTHFNACGFQFADFLHQVRGRHHDAIAEIAGGVRMQHARRNQAQHRLFAVDDQCVAGIVAALKAHDDVGLLRQPVDNLAFSLVAPLGADDHGAGHVTDLLASRCRSA